MTIALTDAERAFYLLLVAVCLGVCVVWALWELDQKQERRERMLAAGNPHEAPPTPPYE